MRFYSIYFSVFVLSSPFLHSETYSLKDAEETAIANNKQVQATRQLLEKARQGKLESYSKWLPHLFATTEMNLTQNKQEKFVNSRRGFLTQLALSQAIFTSEAYYGVKLAELYVKQLKLLLEAAINDALYSVRTAYYQVILDQKNIATAKENTDLFTSLVEMMQGNYNSGLAILYDVNQSKVIVANSLTQYYQAIKRYRIDLDYFTEVLGTEPGSIEISLSEENFPLEKIPEISTKLDIVVPIFSNNPLPYSSIYDRMFPQSQMGYMQKLFSSEEVQFWEDTMQRARPSLRISQNYVDIADETIRSRIGEYYPMVLVEGQYGGDPTEYIFLVSDRFTNQNFNWGLKFKLSWDVFDGLGRERRIKKARYEKRALVYQYENTLLEAFADLRKQIFTIEESIASYLSSKGNVSLANETLLLAKERLEVGYITIFDYQISVDGLIQARYNLDQAEYDTLSAYYALRHASGIDVSDYYREFYVEEN